MKKNIWKEILPYAVALVVFIVLTVIYMSPMLDGKVIQAGDTKSYQGMAQETNQYREETGEESYWTGSMFCGMPMYQIGCNYPKAVIDVPFDKIVRLGFPYIMALVLCYFIGYFILLRAFKVNKWLSIVGAIAIALSSYFFIIIGAGHNSKAAAMGLLPPVVAGFYLIFQKKYGAGIILTLIYSSVALMSHPQMTYYICLLIAVMFCAELYIHIKERRWKDLLLGTLAFAFAFCIGLGTQYAPFAATQEYSKETMRGGHSELAKQDDVINKTSGLDLDYATAWSYGIDETMTLMIPGFMGYSSNYNVGTDSKVYAQLVSNGVPRKSAADFCKNVPTYWGEQPFTSGPVYVGAIVCFLFILGLIIVKGPYKWALLVATLFSILLSWGHNFMPLTKFFFQYFPMYAKFRSVSSVLVVAEITMPLLGFLAIKQIMDKTVTKKRIMTGIYISAGVTAGICLIFAIFGGMMFKFTSPNDEQIFTQLPDWLTPSILAERASMLRMSALRSFIFIALAAALLWLYTKEKLKFAWFACILGVLVLADMWPIDRHFLNNDNFVSPKQDKNYFKKQPYEEYLLADNDPHFRVLNLTTNTFNESRTSYYLKSIGGYHAAKLRRYQDLIDQHISKMEMPVLNMLNAKYIIVPGNDGQPIPQLNQMAMGNAWYVDSLVLVSTPNEESDTLSSINLRNTAVVDIKAYDGKFAPMCKNFVPGHDSTASIKLTKYAPDYIEYQSTASKPGTVIFSEIYYPYGWDAYIDGKPVDHFRANYTLRGLNVPAGNHHIRFEFRPKTVQTASMVAHGCKYAMYVTILAIIGIAIYQGVQKKKKKKINKTTEKVNSKSTDK